MHRDCCDDKIISLDRLWNIIHVLFSFLPLNCYLQDPLTSQGAIERSLNAGYESALPSTPAECAWFCDGRMLHINQPRLTEQAMALFKSEWAKGKVRLFHLIIAYYLLIDTFDV